MKRRDLIWSVVLALGGTALGVVFLCIAPFAAVAALATRTLARRAAIAAVVTMWFLNQAIGFGILHYPRNAPTIGWSAAILVASVGSALVATSFRNPFFAFAAAFATYEVTLFAWGALHGVRGGFSADVVAEVFVANVAGLAILTALRAALVASLGAGSYARP
jgi:hypothetical protein